MARNIPKKKKQDPLLRQAKKEWKQMQDDISREYQKIMVPIATMEAFLRMVCMSELVLHDKFGFGKERLHKFSKAVIDQFDCIQEERVKLQEISDEVYRITGTRWELTEEEVRELEKDAMMQLAEEVKAERRARAYKKAAAKPKQV